MTAITLLTALAYNGSHEANEKFAAKYNISPIRALVICLVASGNNARAPSLKRARRWLTINGYIKGDVSTDRATNGTPLHRYTLTDRGEDAYGEIVQSCLAIIARIKNNAA